MPVLPPKWQDYFGHTIMNKAYFERIKSRCTNQNLTHNIGKYGLITLKFGHRSVDQSTTHNPLSNVVNLYLIVLYVILWCKTDPDSVFLMKGHNENICKRNVYQPSSVLVNSCFILKLFKKYCWFKQYFMKA